MPGFEFGVGHAGSPSGRTTPQIWPHTHSVSPSQPGALLSPQPSPIHPLPAPQGGPGLRLSCLCLPDPHSVPGPPAPCSGWSPSQHCPPLPSTPGAASSFQPSRHTHAVPKPCLTPLHLQAPPPALGLGSPSLGVGGVGSDSFLRPHQCSEGNLEEGWTKTLGTPAGPSVGLLRESRAMGRDSPLPRHARSPLHILLPLAHPSFRIWL